MGPSRARDQKLAQDNMKALLRERDDRIATLETRLEAHNARASTAHIRLLKTIDVLDALRSQHALEISAEEQAKLKLAHEVDCWRSVAKNLEVEKDELKDVVEDLIEKVQVSNEWSSWPCSQMHITKHAGNLNVEFPEQVTTGTIDAGMKDKSSSDLLAYATSIIARLRTELDLERQSHSRTVEEANLRVEELEAKVAVREAELERCITSHGERQHQPRGPENTSTSTSAFEKQKLGERLPKPKPLSDGECLRFLESNSARNRSLELEVRHIAEKLEQVRMAASTSGSSRKEPQSPRDGQKAIPTPSPRARSASVDPNTLSRPLDAAKPPAPPAPASPSTMLSIAQLDNQIRTMTAQMDALVSERTTLIEAAARQRRVTDGMNIDTFQDVLRVEGECVRLQAEVDDLREQLRRAHALARSREKALVHEIAQLRATASSSSVLHPAPDLHRIFSPQPLEDDITNEESMELASPLMPTIAPSVPASRFHDSETEPELVSFPFSPNHMSSPPPEIPVTPIRTTYRSPGSQEVEMVQEALDAARTHLAQKEEALTQLRGEVECLQLEMRARTQSDEDRDVG